jgi:OFA family oxalate/formate antiporter-like MFS transporter
VVRLRPAWSNSQNAGINYGILFTAWGVAGIIGPRITGVLYDRYQNYKAAFYTAAALAALALLFESGAKRPVITNEPKLTKARSGAGEKA